MSRSGLNTAELHRLDALCREIVDAFDTPPYLVGTADERTDYRDVDVRLILDDETWDVLFKERAHFLSLICYAISEWLTHASELPIDFQIQRRTEANEKFGDKRRNPLGRGRLFAGGGDASGR